MAPLMDHCDEKPLQNGSLEKEDDEEEAKEKDCKKQPVTIEEQHKLEEEKQRQKKKYTRLSRLRRRRCAHKDARGEDESDLSEGFESEEDEDEDEERRASSDPAGGSAERTPDNAAPIRKAQKRDHLGEEGSWGSGSDEEEEEEEGGTAFDVETDSDMNSQESRSDLEDMEDGENSLEAQGREQQGEGDEQEGQPKGERNERDRETPPTANGPLLPADSSISSNLQAMSSQLFQAKRCFRLAPTFSNMLLRPQASSSSGTPNPTPTDTSAPPSQETPPPLAESLSDVNPATANGTTENGTAMHLKGFQ